MNKMYKRAIILSLLVAATTGFPTSDINDFDTTRSSKDNDSINKSNVLPTKHKSLTTLETDSGNLDKLIEESVSVGKPRKARNCIFSIAKDCSENGLNSEVVLKHLRHMQENLQEHSEKVTGIIMQLVAVAMSDVETNK